MRGLVRTVVLVAAMAFATTASAQNYPSGPVKLIVPVPAGGVTDVMARIVGQRLQELWGQTVVVENRPGGNYGVGAQAVERAPPDGLTLLVAPDSTFTANPALFSKLIYDPDAFTPIAVLCRATPMLMVNPSLPVKSVSELVAYAKANPGKLSYGSFGTGTYAHLSMEDLKQRTGMDIQHVPYRGAAPGLTGLLGNEVSVMLLNLSSVEEHAKTGKVRLIAAATDKRVASLPDLPTVAETCAGLPDVGLVRSVGTGEVAARNPGEDPGRRRQGAGASRDQAVLQDQQLPAGRPVAARVREPDSRRPQALGQPDQIRRRENRLRKR